MKGTAGIMVASHNEDTVRYAINQMKKMGFKPEEKVVCFGQLLGMCDHITFPLGECVIMDKWVNQLLSVLQACHHLLSIYVYKN